jgi:hypothetical protein
MSLAVELADVMLPELQRIRADYRQDSLPISAGLYEAFLAKGATGRDALLCYLHLLWTYRKQGTNRPWAVSRYLENGLNLSPKRVRIAKGLLCRMQLIEYIQEKKGRGQFGKVYTKLNLVSNPFAAGALTTLVEKGREITAGAPHRPGGPVRQMLEERIRERVEQPSAESKPTASPSPAKGRGPRTPHGRLRALFSELYRQNTSAARAPFNAACAGQLKNDLARLGEERLSRALRSIFETPPPRMRALDYLSVHHFLPDIEKRLADEERRLSLIRVCPHCGKKQEHTGADCLYCQAPLAEARHVG